MKMEKVAASLGAVEIDMVSGTAPEDYRSNREPTARRNVISTLVATVSIR
jgi:hypothetical protein